MNVILKKKEKVNNNTKISGKKTCVHLIKDSIGRKD